MSLSAKFPQTPSRAALATPAADGGVQSQVSSRINWPAWLIFMLAMVLVVGEGALRKWVELFSSGMPRNAAYFSKDIVFSLLLLLPLSGVNTPVLAQFARWLSVGSVLFLVGASLSSFVDVNAVGSALTLRAVIVLPVIALMAVRRLGGVPVRHVAWLVAGLTALNFALASAQNQLPVDHFLNEYASKTEAIAQFGYSVRATGTFSYISGLGVMSMVGIWSGLALLSLSHGTKEQIAGYVAMGAGFGCGFASVSRAPVVIGAAMVVVWLVFSFSGRDVLGRRLLAALVVATVVWVSGLFDMFSRLGQNLWTRNEQADDTFEQRGFGALAEMFTALERAPLGRGLGTEQVGGNFARSGEMTFTNYESQLPRLVMESGVLGVIGFLVVCAGALLALERARREVATREEKGLLLTTELLLLPMFYTNVVFNHVASAFVWIIFAIVLANVRSNPTFARPHRRRDRHVPTADSTQ
jgi:hypothetical protein